MAALPFLEQPLASFKRRLEQAVRDVGATVDPDSFPAMDLIRFGLQSPGAYWREQALGWAEQLAGPGSALLADLEDIIAAKWPAPLRKRARQLRDRLRAGEVK